MSNPLRIALIGNPNTGKTSLFNALTGLTQKVGNYPGITVDKKVGSCTLSKEVKAEVIDLPGTYSLNPSSQDEDVAVKVLTNEEGALHPDVVVVVAEVENLKRNLLIYTQIKELGLPTLLAINMQDQMQSKGIDLDIAQLEQDLDTKITLLSTKKRQGVASLKQAILEYKSLSLTPLNLNNEESVLGKEERKVDQHRKTVQRYQFINKVLAKSYTVDKSKAKDWRSKIDRILTHKIGGYVIFFAIIFGIFQALFAWSSIPMDFIDAQFGNLAEWSKESLPAGLFNDLLSDGIIPGLGGVLIFIPQIAYLFLILSILEETGYMSRVVFLMDKIMRRFGLSGKSVVPLVSGAACAIPAIMATRNIESWKERLITILVAPFITCSARLPVYAIIISLTIPDEITYFGMNLQGVVLMGLYLLGFVVAILSAGVLNKVLKLKTDSYFVVEMPDYKWPLAKNVLYYMVEKTKAFVWEAGKIIMAISILLWALASFGPESTFGKAETIVANVHPELQGDALENEIAAYKLEHSYIGMMGKSIEPVITPLGYDWKIGIALITSFAAREVFVGTLATIYSVGSEDEGPIKARMEKERHHLTGKPVYNLASGLSILMFYAFAMQCMSTIAIVKRETNGWKWPLIQFFGMTAIAYISALLIFQWLK